MAVRLKPVRAPSRLKAELQTRKLPASLLDRGPLALGDALNSCEFVLICGLKTNTDPFPKVKRLRGLWAGDS